MLQVGGIVIRRKIQITVESERVLVMRQAKDGTRSWCDVCAKQVEMLRVADLSGSALTSLSTIFGEAPSSKPHLVKAPSGLTFVCLNSLVS